MAADHRHTHKAAEAGGCFVHAVTEVFAEEPQLEAVELDRSARLIQVATLGRADDPAIEARVSAQVEAAEKEAGAGGCGFLVSPDRCKTCDRSGHLNPTAFTLTHAGGRTTIARASCPTAPSFWHWRNIPWPKLVARELDIPDDHDHAGEWKWQLAAAAVCGVAGLAGAFAEAGPAARAVAFFAAYLAGSWYAAVEVWELLQERKLDVHFLMLAVAGGSAAIGAYTEGATLLFLFSFSSALEHYAMARTQGEIRSLFHSAPKVAVLLDGEGREVETPVESLRPGMRLLVRPDTQIAVDGEIVKGRTACDESTLTGESAPVEKGPGDQALAGTMNLWGAVEMIVRRPASESALQKIIQLIREAQHLKAPTQRFTDKFGSRYTLGILGLSAMMFFYWWLVRGLAPFAGNEPHRSAFYNSMVLLVVASPCALVLSTPSAVLAAIAWGARRGILFRGGAAVEKLSEVDVVALDKTGTLTMGEPRVLRVESFPPGREAEVAVLAYSLEKMSQHPLARAISLHGRRQHLEALELVGFASVAGQGLRADYQGREARLGRKSWIEAIPGSVAVVEHPPEQLGCSEVWLRYGDLTGRILMRDEIRPEAKGVLEALRAAGLHTVVLTGDRAGAALRVAEALVLDEIRAELKPEQKVAAIQEMTIAGRRVAMVGDGVNDAPSLAAAHVGVAMGARGSDAAMEQADIVLMNDRLENVREAYQLSQRARAIIRQNVGISLGTVAVLACAAMLGLVPLTIGVVGHEGSTVVVVMNSLRLLLGGNKNPRERRETRPPRGVINTDRKQA